jgi:hypothetical protein
MSTLDEEEDCDLGSEFSSLTYLATEFSFSLFCIPEKKAHKKSGAQMTQSVRCQKKQTISVNIKSPLPRVFDKSTFLKKQGHV